MRSQPPERLRRFQQWRHAGAMDQILEVLAKDLEQRGKINLDESNIAYTKSLCRVQ